MAATKTIVATETHKRKDWTIVLTGTGKESRDATVKALSVLDAKGLKIVSGASPFAESKRRKPKAKVQALPLLYDIDMPPTTDVHGRE
jgi:hypothetical protein